MPNQTFFNLPEQKRNRIIDAAIKEISEHPYEHLNFSNIIRDASIPRGSFYQYFKGKDDLYTYIYQYIGQKKLSYIGPYLDPSLDMSFLDRFYQIYLNGFAFAKAEPKLVKASEKMLTSTHYSQSPYIKDAMHQAVIWYAGFIKKDQMNGLIRSDIDPDILASFVIEFMTKMTLDQFQVSPFSLEAIEKIVLALIDILKKGIENHV